MAVAARSVPGPAVGEIDPLHLRGGRAAVHPGPSGHGGAGRADQRGRLDDHRPFPHSARPRPAHDRSPPLHRHRRVGAAARRLRPAQQQPGVPRRAALGRETDHGQPAADLAARCARPRISAKPTCRRSSARTARRCRARPIMRSISPSNFANWRLAVDGLVARPLSIPIQTLRSLPHRTQITRHDCVEGWSAIGKWHGVAAVADPRPRGLSTRAKYIVFHCADRFGDKPYYESVDLVDAFHPQTILAWGMNGHLLPVPERRAAAAAGSSGSSATSRPSMCSGSRRSTASRGSSAARAAIGKIMSIMNGTRGFEDRFALQPACINSRFKTPKSSSRKVDQQLRLQSEL